MSFNYSYYIHLDSLTLKDKSLASVLPLSSVIFHGCKFCVISLNTPAMCSHYTWLLLLWSIVRLCMQYTWRAYQLHQAPFLSFCQKTQDSRFYRPYGYRRIASPCLGLRRGKPRPEETNRKKRSNSGTCLDP